MQSTRNCNESVNGSWLRELLLKTIPSSFQTTRQSICPPTQPNFISPFYLTRTQPSVTYVLSCLCFYQVSPIHLKHAPFPFCLWKVYPSSNPAQRFLITGPGFIMSLSYELVKQSTSYPLFIPLLNYNPSLSSFSCINLSLPAGLILLAHNYVLLSSNLFFLVLKTLYSPKYHTSYFLKQLPIHTTPTSSSSIFFNPL